MQNRFVKEKIEIVGGLMPVGVWTRLETIGFAFAKLMKCGPAVAVIRSDARATTNAVFLMATSPLMPA